MVEIAIEGETAVFEVRGKDKLWSLRSRLELPLAHIKGFKLAGTEIPNFFRAGTFYQDGGLVFWDVRHPEKTIVVELIHEIYRKLVIEVADPDMAVALINAACRAS